MTTMTNSSAKVRPGFDVFELDPQIERGLAILEMNQDGVKEIESAPQSFEGLFN